MLRHHCGDPTFSRHLKGRRTNIRLIFRLRPLRELIFDCLSDPVLHVSFHFTHSRCTRWHFNRASNQVVGEGVCSGGEGCWGAAGTAVLRVVHRPLPWWVSAVKTAKVTTADQPCSRASEQHAEYGRKDFSPFVLFLSAIIPRYYPLFIWLYFPRFLALSTSLCS